MPFSVRARQLGYRLAFRVLQVAWFVRRPQKQGVKCLITCRGRLLLVRHTYGSREWDLPGGAIKRDEPPLTAARREMREELGIEDAEWIAAGVLRGSDSFRHDTIHCFRAELASERVQLDPVELATVMWFAPAALPAALARYAKPLIDGALAPATPRS